MMLECANGNGIDPMGMYIVPIVVEDLPLEWVKSAVGIVLECVNGNGIDPMGMYIVVQLLECKGIVNGCRKGAVPIVGM